MKYGTVYIFDRNGNEIARSEVYKIECVVDSSEIKGGEGHPIVAKVEEEMRKEQNKMHEQEFFYTAKPVGKKVTKEEFERYISNYPRRLEVDVCGISDPPLISYNDFELANRWPYSVVARTWAYDDNPNDYFYEPEEEREYYIIENYEELFLSKTGNMA